MTYKSGSWGDKAKARSRKRNEYFRKYAEKFRLKALKELGGKCKRCGFSDWRALEIDHINGGGGKEWTNINRKTRYEMVTKNPERYQVLCANCNTIKKIENGELRKAG